MKETADAGLVIVNANLWNPGYDRPRKKALAIGGGKVIRLGSNAQCEAESDKETRILDVSGRIVIPGFVDAHAHLMHTGPRLSWRQLQSVPSLKRLLSVVKTEASKVKHGKWVLGWGWDESKWPERIYPTLIELDAAAGSAPVFLRRVDGHMAVVNTVALREFRISRNTDGLHTDSEGRPTGALTDAALEIATMKLRPSVDELVEHFPRIMRMAHRHGITSIHDIVDSSDISAYLRLYRSRRLAIRVNLMPPVKLITEESLRSASPHRHNEWLRLGAIKLYSDGSLGSRTAALYEPYMDGKGRGRLNYGSDKLKNIFLKIHRLDHQIAVHAIGDRAIDAVVDAYSSTLDVTSGFSGFDHRHRIEHFELPTEEALEGCKELGITIVMQPNFVVQWSNRGGMYESRLGRARAGRNNPYGLILQKGLDIAFSSDGMPYGPIFGLQGAVKPAYSGQHLSLSRAVEAYTRGGAFASFEEGQKGELLPGKLADLAVINGIWSSAASKDWSIAATIVGGNVVYMSPAIDQA